MKSGSVYCPDGEELHHCKQWPAWGSGEEIISTTHPHHLQSHWGRHIQGEGSPGPVLSKVPVRPPPSQRNAAHAGLVLCPPGPRKTPSWFIPRWYGVHGSFLKLLYWNWYRSKCFGQLKPLWVYIYSAFLKCGFTHYCSYPQHFKTSANLTLNKTGSILYILVISYIF